MASGGPLVWLIYLILLIGIGIIFYFKSRKTLFEINYAGGKIAFDISLYSKAEIENFQKQLRHAKDIAVEKNTNSNNSPNYLNNSKADEIAKYFDLYKQGILSSEEFEDIKKKSLE